MLDDSARVKMMAGKLMEEVSSGNIDNDWAETFIADIHSRVNSGRLLTDKQLKKLEELFEEY